MPFLKAQRSSAQRGGGSVAAGALRVRLARRVRPRGGGPAPPGIVSHPVCILGAHNFTHSGVSMSNATDISSEPTTASDAVLEAAREALSAISEHVEQVILRWVGHCVARARLMGVAPTVADIAFLSLEAVGGMRPDRDITPYDSAREARLQRVRELTKVDVAPFDGTEFKYTKGRDLSVWFAPLGPFGGDSTALTREQCAYGIRNEVLAELDDIVQRVMHEDAAVEHDEQTLDYVNEAVIHFTEWFLSPGFTRHNVDGYIRCGICGVELCYLNMAELGVRDECVLCRGWLTSGQRLMQPKPQREPHITEDDFFRGWASPRQTWQTTAA